MANDSRLDYDSLGDLESEFLADLAVDLLDLLDVVLELLPCNPFFLQLVLELRDVALAD